MGFSAGLYSYPIYKGPDSCTKSQRYLIEQILSYDKNEWAKEHFSTPKEYAYYATGLEEEVVPYPSDDMIDFFRQHLITDEFGYERCYKSYGYWGSYGSNDIYKWFEKNGANDDNKDNYGLNVSLTKQNIVDFVEFCIQQIEKTLPKECSFTYAYKEIYPVDEQGEHIWVENPEIHLFPCDGIEVNYLESGNTKRIWSGGDEPSFSLPEGYYEEGEVYAYMEGIRAGTKILGTVDFENEQVYYNGGW